MVPVPPMAAASVPTTPLNERYRLSEAASLAEVERERDAILEHARARARVIAEEMRRNEEERLKGLEDAREKRWEVEWSKASADRDDAIAAMQRARQVMEEAEQRLAHEREAKIQRAKAMEAGQALCLGVLWL